MLNDEQLREAISFLEREREDTEQAIAALKRLVARRSVEKTVPENQPKSTPKLPSRNRYVTTQRQIAIMLKKIGAPATPYQISQELKKIKVVVTEAVIKQLLTKSQTGVFVEPTDGMWKLAEED